MLRRFGLVLRLLASAVCVLLVATQAHAASFTIHTVMRGINEVPPNASPATGTADITVNGDTLSVEVDWSGLIGGNPSAAHIHCCTPVGTNVGVAVGFPSFPSTTSGSYFH